MCSYTSELDEHEKVEARHLGTQLGGCSSQLFREVTRIKLTLDHLLYEASGKLLQRVVRLQGQRNRATVVSLVARSL